MESHTFPFPEEARHIGPAEEYHHHIDLEEHHTGLEEAVRRVTAVVADRDRKNVPAGLDNLVEGEHRRDSSRVAGIHSWILEYHRVVVDLVAVRMWESNKVSLLNYT